MSSTLSLSRVGARRRSEIPDRVLDQLNAGSIESATLVEVLAIDFAQLLGSAVPTLPSAAIVNMRLAAFSSVTQRMAFAGKVLLEHLGPAAFLRLARHRSDTVRGWAAFLLAEAPGFTLGERLRLMRILANDHNAGVREWAWLALRESIASDVAHAIDLLEPWTVSTSPFLRRFAVEATRPRGVWCAHIAGLKRQPALGLPLLEPLRNDPHKYVQDSVANWLSDAAKCEPIWVQELCARWSRESRSPATERICQRAQRSLPLNALGRRTRSSAARRR